MTYFWKNKFFKFWFILAVLFCLVPMELRSAPSAAPTKKTVSHPVMEDDQNSSQILEYLHDLEMIDGKIPFYREGELRCIAFPRQSNGEGSLFSSKDVTLDCLLENANCDLVVPGWVVKLYDLNASLRDVLAFWQTHYLTSEAVIFTEECKFAGLFGESAAGNRKSNTQAEAVGEKLISLRSPMLDLDGYDFKVDFSQQVLEINSDVKIIVRKKNYDPRALLKSGKISQETIAGYVFITATSDSLRLDLKRKELRLAGHVKVIDGANKLNCRRLTVFMTDEAAADGAKISETEKKALSGNKDMLKDVSRILADGDVVLTMGGKEKNDPQKKEQAATIRADHFDYDVIQDKIALTGIRKNPVLHHGSEMLSGKRMEVVGKNRIFIFDECRLSSVETVAGGLREQFSVISRRGDYDLNTGIATLDGDVEAAREGSNLKCGNMRIRLRNQASAETVVEDDSSPLPFRQTGSSELENVFCSGKVNIRISQVNMPEQKEKMTAPVEINSGQAEWNFPENKVIFYDTVRIAGGDLLLGCDRLDIWLEKKGVNTSETANSRVTAMFSSSGLAVKKIIAAGKVYMSRDRLNNAVDATGKKQTDLEHFDIKTDLLTMYFRPVPPGRKNEAGLFQTGESELAQIFADGSVVGTSWTKPAETAENKSACTQHRVLQAEHAICDFLTDKTEFHQKVHLQDKIKKSDLKCRDLFIFSKKHDGQIIANAGIPVRNEEQLLDDDPFYLPPSEGSVPQSLTVNDSTDIQQIIAKHNVVMVYGSDGVAGKSQAGGDTAVYTVKTGKLTITSERPRRPWLRSNGRRQECDEIIGDLKNENFIGRGHIVITSD